jgi:hypothetical protein
MRTTISTIDKKENQNKANKFIDRLNDFVMMLNLLRKEHGITSMDYYKRIGRKPSLEFYNSLREQFNEFEIWALTCKEAQLIIDEMSSIAGEIDQVHDTDLQIKVLEVSQGIRNKI